MRRNAALAMMCAASVALCATTRPAEEATDEERKVPPPEPVKPRANLPGETNRQLAARLAAERTLS